MNPRELGFRSAMTKCAALYANTLPDWGRRKALAGAGVAGAALGASATMAMIALLKRRQHALASPKAQTK